MKLTAPTKMDVEDPQQVRTYLRERGFGGMDGMDGITVRVLPGGVSCKTVLVESSAGGSVVLKQALPKLRVKVDWFSPPARIHREALGLRWLQRLEPAGSVPAFLFEDFDHHILAMSAVPDPHVNLKDELMAGRISMDAVEQMGTLLARMHALPRKFGSELVGDFAESPYFESLRLEPYYLYTAGEIPAAKAFLLELVEATRKRRDALVHGDFSPKNILLHGGRNCLLDHEVIHLGDAAFDLGFALAHFLSKARHFPARREAFAEAARHFFAAYLHSAESEGQTGEQIEERAVRHALGCLLARVAGRSQLEYLSTEEKACQAHHVTLLMHAPPANVAALIEAF